MEREVSASEKEVWLWKSGEERILVPSILLNAPTGDLYVELTKDKLTGEKRADVYSHVHRAHAWEHLEISNSNL